ANMAAPDFSAGEFEKWLYERLDGLGADREVYGAYILGVLHEEDSEEERSDALSGILSAFVDEETLEEVCQQILKQWAECCSQNAGASNQLDACKHPSLLASALFKNTNVEDVLNRRRQQREQAKEGAQKKKEQDKMQREKDKLTKQERKEREKKRTQKGERKR
ncbi:coiled-coil domain-containing protein 43, partial [Silurus asotus]